MDLRTTTRMFWKIIFSWIVIISIFFLNPKNVNLPEQPDRILQDEHISKKIQKTQTIKEEKKPEKKEPVISENEKYEFLLNILKQALSKVHWSSIQEDSFDKLCTYYKTYCNIIDISSTDFNHQERTYYVWITVYLLKFIDNIFDNVEENIYYIKIQKSKNWRRWYAWHHSIIMNIKDGMDYNNFLEVLTHELWHVIDLWFIEWKSYKKSSTFKEFGRENFAKDDDSIDFYSLSFLSEKVKKPWSYAKDFVSWYALTNIFEDFAESFNMYVNHNHVFRQMAKESNILQKKYNIIDDILDGKYLQTNKNFDYKYSYRPWDTTKIK